MEATTGLLIGGVVVGGGLLVLHLRRKKAEEAAAPPARSKCDKAADLARVAAMASGNPAAADQAANAAKTACEILDKIPIPDVYVTSAEEKANNEGKNGKIVQSWHPAHFANRYQLHEGQNYLKTLVGPTQGLEIRHENGCTPFLGSPGWAKCAAGTSDRRAAWPGAGDKRRDASGLGTGRDDGRDLLTGPHYSREEVAKWHPHYGKLIANAWKPYPIPVPSGHTAYWVGGKPLPKPDGAVLAVDQRTSPPTMKWIKPAAPPPDRDGATGWWSNPFSNDRHGGEPSTDYTTDGNTRDHRDPAR